VTDNKLLRRAIEYTCSKYWLTEKELLRWTPLNPAWARRIRWAYSFLQTIPET
jgi:hypothetical protein